jgi:crotonobetaine/carnitine-CoA ligase
LEEQAAVHHDREILNFKGLLSVSYRQLNENANQYANAFLQKGITKHTKVAVMLPNCPEYLYCWFGLAKIGAVIVPVNTAQKGELLKYIIDSSDCEAVVTDDALLSRTREIDTQIGKVRQVFLLEDTGRIGTSVFEVVRLMTSERFNRRPISK